MGHSELELVELAGGFIHELKNHLSTLTLNLQLLAEDFAEPQNHRERRAAQRVARLHVQCQRLSEVSNDFLRYARIQELRTHPCRLEEVLGDMVDFFSPTARQANIQISCMWASDVPAVALDVELFKQAILNLLLNAEQAMPGGGELTVQLYRGANDGVHIGLIDTGQGMSEEVLAKLFRPFFTTKPGGTGLGLPITRRIIQAHGGTLTVQSAVARGTKFDIWLPSVPVSAAVAT
jgi:signal transduction histidine kinase